MTGSQILTLFLSLTDKNSNDDSYRALALQWLKLVYKDISNRQQNYHWRWLEKTATTDTVADQHTYDLPTDCDTNKIIAVYERTNDITYTYIPYEEFVRKVANPSNDIGIPCYWTYFAKSMRLYPVPDSVITIYMDYIKIPTEPADDSETLDIPAKYDEVVIDGMLKWAFKFDQELGQWANQTQVYESGINRMIQDNNMAPAETKRPETHRNRYRSKGDVDGKNSILFPLDNTSI